MDLTQCQWDLIVCINNVVRLIYVTVTRTIVIMYLPKRFVFTLMVYNFFGVNLSQWDGCQSEATQRPDPVPRLEILQPFDLKCNQYQK